MWSEEGVALLTKLWAEGKSGTEIALEMGRTRCSILGKVHKLGLPKRITKTRAPYGSSKLVRGQPKWQAPPRTSQIPVSLSVPMKAKGRPAGEGSSKFDSSPASQLAAAMLGSAYAAEARRDGFRATIR